MEPTSIPFLLFAAMITAIAHAPLNIYDVHARNLGTVKTAPWGSKMSAGVKAVASSLASLLSYASTHRRALAAAAALLVCACAQPDQAEGAAFAVVAIAGYTVNANIAQLERDLAKVGTEATALLEKTARECQAHKETVNGKEVNGRLMTTEERAAIQVLVDKGNGIKEQLDNLKGDANLAKQIEQMTGGLKVEGANPEQAKRVVRKSLGQQFIDSDAMSWLKSHRGMRGSRWNTPTVELNAATLTEDAASGGDLIVSDYRPGIVPLTFKRLTIGDLLASGTTDSNSITYMKETTFTNAAATVAEGAAKPESTLVFDQVTDLVQKIAHWLPVTDEMLEDVAQIRSYIDARLRLGVELTEEDQLLNGDGTPPNISGILDRTGLTAAQARGADTNADAIFKEMMKVFDASFIMPDAHVINPTNWQTIQLSKDANGQYYGSGPFAGPQPATLWGLPVAVTPSIAAGTALTGSFKSSAQVFRKGGIRVEVSNSHDDYFVKNLVAIRAEERLALAVYRPSAFGTTTGLN